MAMRPALYSINGLATELGRDARALAKVLAHTRPDGVTGAKKVPAWRMTTALRAIASHETRRGSDPAVEKAEKACDAAERAGRELEDALNGLAAEPDLESRRARAKSIGPLLVVFQEALEKATEIAAPDLIELGAPFREKLLSAALSRLLALCQWRLVA